MEEFAYTKNRCDELLRKREATSVIDTVNEQIHELFLIRNPEYKYKKKYDKQYNVFLYELCRGKEIDKIGSWFVFPWSKQLVHYLPEDLHLELRTARNRNLITKEEQEKFYHSTVAIAGLSIGSHAAFTIAMMGGSKSMKLADPDILSGSNMNRVRYDFTQIGGFKADLAVQGILKINPFTKVEVYKKGVLKGEIEQFLSSPKVDVLIEEVDNLSLKFELRFVAKKLRIPVVMATDNGDNVIVDVERYDTNPKLPIFNGLVGDLSYQEFQEIPKETLPLLVGNIVGIDLVTPQVFESLSEVGKSLYSWPQLGSAANMSGSILAYLARKIINKENIKSGKYDISIDKAFSA